MTITNGYTTLALARSWIYRGQGTVSTANDSVIEDTVEAVSRWIDNYCGRKFYTSLETRHYTAQDDDILFTDDLVSISTLKSDDDGDRTYETTWTTSDYDLMPLNASSDVRPYTFIEVSQNGDYAFPKGIKKGVQLYGTFGWPTTHPKEVGEACLIQVHRIFDRANSPYGISGVSELGVLQMEPELDVDVKNLLANVRRIT